MNAALDELDTAAEARAVKHTVADIVRPEIHNGFYTVTFPCGTHRTFRLYTQQKGKLAGMRLLGLLIGPDNTADYEDFAFLTQAECGFVVWKRFQNQRQAEYAKILWKLLGGEILEGFELSESRRCLRCNRRLTDDYSIKVGIGPSCRGGDK